MFDLSNLHRIHWIDAQIRANRFPNCRLIAEHFEISSRQASRDIEYLRYSMGAPVEYAAVKNGYYYSNAVFSLPLCFISEEEKINLKFLADQYMVMKNTQAVRLAELFTRLADLEQAPGGSHMSLPVFPVNTKVVNIFSLMKKAIENHIAIEVRYMNNNNKKSLRVFHPYKLFNRNQQYYIVGFCTLRNELRVLRLDRILSVEPTDTAFSIVQYFQESDYKEDTHFSYKSAYKCKIRSDKTIDFGKLKSSLQNEQGYLYTVEFTSSEELLSHMLSHFDSFTILSPNWLKEKLKDRLRKILEHNF